MGKRLGSPKRRERDHVTNLPFPAKQRRKRAPRMPAGLFIGRIGSTGKARTRRHWRSAPCPRRGISILHFPKLEGFFLKGTARRFFHAQRFARNRQTR